MENNTGRSGGDVNDIRRDAQRRMEQMQQKVPYKRQRNMRSFYGNNMNNRNSGNAINRANSSGQRIIQETEKREVPVEEPVTEEFPKAKTAESFKLPFGIGSGLEKYLENLDTDKILIISLLAMIYKDGGNKKLMMALAYLLT